MFRASCLGEKVLPHIWHAYILGESFSMFWPLMLVFSTNLVKIDRFFVKIRSFSDYPSFQHCSDIICFVARFISARRIYSRILLFAPFLDYLFLPVKYLSLVEFRPVHLIRYQQHLCCLSKRKTFTIPSYSMFQFTLHQFTMRGGNFIPYSNFIVSVLVVQFLSK